MSKWKKRTKRKLKLVYLERLKIQTYYHIKLAAQFSNINNIDKRFGWKLEKT